MNNLTRGRPEDDTLRKEVAGRYKLRCVKLETFWHQSEVSTMMGSNVMTNNVGIAIITLLPWKWRSCQQFLSDCLHI